MTYHNVPGKILNFLIIFSFKVKAMELAIIQVFLLGKDFLLIIFILSSL